MTTRWTRIDELVAMLRKRWNRGRYLRDYANGTTWQPVTLPVKAPTAAEILDDFDDAVRWADRFRRDSQTAGGRPRFAIENRTIQGRGLGVNEVPARIRIETFDQLCALLGTSGDVCALDAIIDQTRGEVPALLEWVIRNPLLAIGHNESWPRLLATVNWIATSDTSQLYLRHIDVAGVDTKFVERHQKVLGQLLIAALPTERTDLTHSDFARRFGFRSKPDYTRLRLLSPVPTFPSGLSELRLRTDELARQALPIGTVFVVENEASYLAFPELPNAIVVFGEGFHVTTLEEIPWLHHKEIVYWGDIDTHGLAILNRLRARFASVRSILMDHETLLAHSAQCVTEPSPTAEPLPHLTTQEQSLYQDLIEDRFGPGVRLEQERIRFSALRRALAPWQTVLPQDPLT
jgi:hypothetical protein